jgi:glycosyltransferase involved in cell wall biosynthesis
VRVLFIYIGVVGGFSGQAAATELIIDGFRRGGIDVSCGWVPHLNRIGKAPKLLRFGAFLCCLLYTYWKFVWMRLPADGAIHLSLGLTRFALIRDGLALWCASRFNAKSVQKVVALNGSVFTEWSMTSLNARLFRWVLCRADTVTCVGTSHRQALIDLRVPSEKIEVVPNVCEYDGIEESKVVEKQAVSDQPIELLFLSSLTDTKGYPEYLEALEMIGSEDGSPIHAVLCGPIMMDAYRKRFETYEEARAWIEQKVASINESERIQAEWIPGAREAEKKALFDKAQIFVLPTQYPVEAQPLVVIEAMAHGCAIVTTDVGELLSTVNAESAAILSSSTSASVKEALDALLENDELRLSLGLGALDRFKSKFNREQYVQRWSELLGTKGLE